MPNPSSTSLRKLVLAAVVVGIGIVASAQEGDLAAKQKFTGFEPQHEWTLTVYGCKVGIESDIYHGRDVVCIHYGPDFVWVPLSFRFFVTAAGAIPVVGGAAAFLLASRLSKRRRDEAV